MKTMVFSKRFLNNSLKHSFTEESCSIEFIKPIDKTKYDTLNKSITSNPKKYEDFTNYIPKPIDSIYNAGISHEKGLSIKEIKKRIPKDLELSEFQITPFLQSIGFNTDEMPAWTIQFVSPDHIIHNKTLIYYFKDVLKY